MNFNDWLEFARSLNGVSVLFILIFIYSAITGMWRGASGSAKRLFAMLVETILVVGSVFVSWGLALWISDWLYAWLMSKHIEMPNQEMNTLQQIYFTLLTSVRDFALFRAVFVFLFVYVLVRAILRFLLLLLEKVWSFAPKLSLRDGRWMSAIIGTGIGSVIGLVRIVMVTALLFTVTVLWPQQSWVHYIEQSLIYKKSAERVIAPLAGQFLQQRAPVIAGAIEAEIANVLQRKYEIIDFHVPDDIQAAALEIIEGASTDEEKAKALYHWVGTRVKYDYNKVELYEKEQIWLEQSPENTFATRKGVCIDYARLYNTMARAVGLEVKIVTGLGYDGQGGYGSHAWNEVFLSEQEVWVPLDATWVSSGQNWFNPPDFYTTHIPKFS